MTTKTLIVSMIALTIPCMVVGQVSKVKGNKQRMSFRELGCKDPGNKVLYPNPIQTRSGFSGQHQVAGNQGVQAMKLQSDTLWSEDFKAGIPSTWTNTGTTNCAWEYRGTATTPNNTVGGRGGCSTGAPLASASANNGFVIFDSNFLDDPSGGCAGQCGSGTCPALSPQCNTQGHTGTLITDTIDLTGNSWVTFSFSTYARTFSSTQTVYVSGDGGVNWTVVWEVKLGANQNTANPLIVDVDMSCAGNSPNVLVRFEFIGSYYEWMLDDIVIKKGKPISDLVLEEMFYLNWFQTPIYTKMPFRQVDSMVFSGVVINASSRTENGVTLLASVNDGFNNVFLGQSAPVTINGCVDSTYISVPGFFSPYGKGNHDFDLTVQSDTSDVKPTNNTLSVKIDITDTVFARDDGVSQFQLNAKSYGVGGGYGFANWFETTASDSITSISVRLGNSTVIGNTIQGKILADDLTTILSSTAFYNVQPGDPGNWITLPLPTPLAVSADFNYLAFVEDLSGTDSALTVSASDIPDSPYSVSFLFYNASQWSAIAEVLFIRLNFKASVLPCNLSVTGTTITGVSCYGGNNGAISGITPVNGTSPFSYLWTPGGSTTPNISGLSAGIYSLAITDSNGCKYTVGVEVPKPDVLQVVLDSVNNVKCFGNANGSIYISGSGGSLVGSPAVNYFSQNFQAGPPMPAGYTLIDNDKLTPDPQSAGFGFGATDSTAWIIINDGFGNFGAYSNSYYTPAGTADDWMITPPVVIGGTNVILSWKALATDPTFADGYEVRISTTTPTIAGCLANPALFTIPAENPTITSRSVNLTSAGYANDTVYIAFRNNSTDKFLLMIDDILVETPQVLGQYTYSIDTGTFQVSGAFTGLAPGSYQLTVKDANGCTSNTTASITQPPVMSLSFGTNTAICGVGGSATANVSGGSTPYAYNWNTTPAQTAAQVTGLVPGTYSVTITDSMGCVMTDSVSVPGTPPVSVNVTGINPSGCGVSDGSVIAIITAGTPPFAYKWNDTAATQNDPVSGLKAGVYTVTVTDSLLCTNTATFVLTDPGAPTLNSSDSMVSCKGGNNGKSTVVVFGGTPPFIYSWSNGENTDTADSLAAGTHSVTVTDAGGCAAFRSVTITEPDSSVAVDTTSVTHLKCNGGANGAVNISSTGGTGAHTYNWSNGATTKNITSLSGGVYTVTVTDANGCTATLTVTVNEPNALVATTSVTNVSCKGGSNGAVDLSVTGGTGTYGYVWSNGSNSEDLAGVAFSTYIVTVTDGNGCTKTASATVTEPATPFIDSVGYVNNATCSGCTDGEIGIVTVGGNAPYTYLWNPAFISSTQIADSLAAGTYSVQVTDANGCTIILNNIVVSQPSGIGEAGSSGKITVQPNPGKGWFRVQLQANDGSRYNVEVHNILGQLLITEEWNGVSKNDVMELNLSKLNKGVYFLTVTGKSGANTSKIVIQ